MNVFYWNCRSIVNKLLCLQTYIYSSNFHVLALSETWLSSRIFDKEIVPFGYTIYRSDRESRGGGVLVCTSHTTPSRLIKSHSSIDMISIEILSSPSIVFCCVYIPPGCTESHFISVVHAIDDLALSFERLIIVGDFNLRDVNWQCLSASSRLSNVFCDLIFQHNLSQLIQMPTHVKGNTLDLLITNIDNHITNLSVTPSIKNLSNFGLSSDHSSITFSVDTTIYSHKKKCRYVFDFSKADFEGLNNYLLDSDFSALDIQSSCDNFWLDLKQSILSACSLFVPKVKLKAFQSPKWFNSIIRHKLHCVHSLRRKNKKSPSISPSLLNKLTSAESELHTLMSNAKLDYEAELFSNFKANHSRIFRYLNSFKQSSLIPQCVYWNMDSATSTIDKVNLFNKYFQSVYHSQSSSLLESFNFYISGSCLSALTFEESDVYTALASLDPSKSIGCDGIGPQLLKACACSLCSPITSLFNLCMSSCSIPSEWKFHMITPILKSGDSTNIANY